MNIEIRHCRETDFIGVYRLLPQLWPDRPLDDAAARKTFVQAIRTPHQYYLCAEVEGVGICGFCSLHLKNSLWVQGYLANIDELIVDENYRGRGIGRMLLERAFKLALRNECGRVELDSAFHRTASHDFYRKLGFSERAYLFTKELAPEQK